jgi:hypothetical protein
MEDVELLRPVEGDPEGTAAVLRRDIPHVLLLPSAGRIARPPQDAFTLAIKVHGDTRPGRGRGGADDPAAGDTGQREHLAEKGSTVPVPAAVAAR